MFDRGSHTIYGLKIISIEYLFFVVNVDKTIAVIVLLISVLRHSFVYLLILYSSKGEVNFCYYIWVQY